jgi:hypothetical protein
MSVVNQIYKGFVKVTDVKQVVDKDEIMSDI